MTFKWVPDTCVQSLNRAVHIWHTQGQRSVSISSSPLQNLPSKLHVRRPLSHKVVHLYWKHIQNQRSRGRRAWLCRGSLLRLRLGSYTSISNFNTSASLGSIDLNNRMSRLKSTFESVSKAVSGTQAEILAKIARLKPNAIQKGNDVQPNPEPPAKEQRTVASITVTPASQTTAAPQAPAASQATAAHLAADLPTAARVPPATRVPPVTAVSPATGVPPATAVPPATRVPPSTAVSPATGVPSATAVSPATGVTPSTISSAKRVPTATAVSPATGVPPATAKPPATVIPPAAGVPSATVVPLATGVPPTTAASPATGVPPTTVVSPATGVPSAAAVPRTTGVTSAAAVPRTTGVPSASAVPRTTGVPSATAVPLGTHVRPATSAPPAPSVIATRLRDQRERKRLRSTESIAHGKGAAKAPLVKPPVSPPMTSSVAKQSPPLFHPSSLSVNLDETFNYLAHHVNAYFGSSTKNSQSKPAGQDGDGQSLPSRPDQNHQNNEHTLVPMSEKTSSGEPVSPPAQSSPSSPKKGLGHYLSYSAPTVQAFVGSYIAPLVPRFRAESKSVPAEEVKPPPVQEVLQVLKEDTENKEQKAADEKAKRLLLQREKIIARVSVDNRTRALVQGLRRASDVRLYINRVEELSYHLLEFPESRVVAVKEKVIPCLLRLRQASDPSLKAAVREALALVGYINPVKSRGIRILSIDGGGTRGLVALQTLHKLEQLSGKRIYQLFDYICGVSTGAILGFMLGVFHIPLNECEELYRKLGSDVFKQNVIIGTVKMGWSHAFYDSEIWENVLKEKMGSDLLVETSRNPNCPKVAAVSTVVNRGTPLKAYVFRNYSLPPGVRSHYRGGCQHKLWEAIRASSAAPGYFQEFAVGGDLHQDGGLLINNPTALALHECKCLWPSLPVQCVVSLGTGRFETPGKHSATYTSLKTKLTNVISSATDTEEVHTMLDALLPPNTYFRFNPYMNEEIALDESRQEKLNLLQVEGLRYLERNEEKLRKAVRILTLEKSAPQRLAEWAKLKADMYEGLPSRGNH